MAMIDISKKTATKREAVVEAKVYVKPQVLKLIKDKKIPKGDALETARIAGVLAAKKTSEIIPLCHSVPIEFVGIEFFLKNREIRIRTTVKGTAKTGVEMEAFVATSTAALTIYDMCKAMDRGMVISDIKLLKKSGGKSNVYVRREA